MGMRLLHVCCGLSKAFGNVSSVNTDVLKTIDSIGMHTKIDQRTANKPLQRTSFTAKLANIAMHNVKQQAVDSFVIAGITCDPCTMYNIDLQQCRLGADHAHGAGDLAQRKGHVPALFPNDRHQTGYANMVEII
jgi:hypothetical protein